MIKTQLDLHSCVLILPSSKGHIVLLKHPNSLKEKKKWIHQKKSNFIETHGTECSRMSPVGLLTIHGSAIWTVLLLADVFHVAT